MPEAEREAVPAGGACNPDRRRPKGCHAGGNAREARTRIEKCRGGAPGGARPTSLGAGRLARRPGVPRWARQGAGASRTERLPALYPLVCEGTKKEASPVRFAVTTDRPGRRSVGCLTSEETNARRCTGRSSPGAAASRRSFVERRGNLPPLRESPQSAGITARRLSALRARLAGGIAGVSRRLAFGAQC